MGDSGNRYELGRGEVELARLEIQGKALAPATRMIAEQVTALWETTLGTAGEADDELARMLLPLRGSARSATARRRPSRSATR